MYQAMSEAGETVLPATMVEDACKNIRLDSGYNGLISLIAVVRNQHPTNFHAFMMGVLAHISHSGIEDDAGSTTNIRRKISEISTSEGEPLMLGGKSCRKWVNERGAVVVPKDGDKSFWDYSEAFRDEVIAHNRKISGKKTKRFQRRDRGRDPNRGDQNRDQNNLSVQIKALIAEIRGGGEDREETDKTEDNKGATTGVLIGRRGEKRTKR